MLVITTFVLIFLDPHLALCVKELLEKSIRHCRVLGQSRQHFVSRVVLNKTRI